MCWARLMDPRQQFSYGPNHCSPHGFVAASSYRCGTGFWRFAASRKRAPGSPLWCAKVTILSNRSRARTVRQILPSRGFTRSKSAVGLDCPHERVRDADGDVEVA